MRLSIAMAGLSAALTAGATQAATVITMSQGVEGQAKTQTIVLEGDKLRMSTPQGGMLFRADMGKVLIIDDKRRTYMEMSPETIQKARAGMDKAMAQMQQRLAAMPEAQRKQIEAMMASRGMPGAGQQTPAAAPQITYQRSGDPRKVGSWNCVPFTMLVNGKPESELCIAKLSDIGLTRDDLKAFVSLSTVMSKQMAGMGGQGGSPMAGADYESLTKMVGFEGYPVQTTHTSPTGQKEFESTLQSIEHKDAPAGIFDIPAGYTKREMGGPMAGGGE